jgi:hypothetical protein
MSRWPILFANAVFVLSCASALPLCAQMGGYTTPPPLSPWLNLYQRQGGPVDNYHMYVQPNLQLQDTLQAQQMGIQRNTIGLNAMGNREMTQTEAYMLGPQPTGGVATFLNHGVYFNNHRQGGYGGGGSFGSLGASGGTQMRNTANQPAMPTGGLSAAGGMSGLGRGL